MALRKKKSKYDELQSRDYKETMAGRDVHNEQDFSKTDPSYGPVSMTSRRVFTVILAIFVTIGAFLILALGKELITSLIGLKGNIMGEIDLSGWFSNNITNVWIDIASVLAGLSTYGFVDWRMKLNLRARNAPYTQGHLTQYTNDAQLQLPDEIIKVYDVFPATGFHSSVSPSSLLSYIPASNKGVAKVPMAKRYTEDGEDEYGDFHYKGEIVYDENGDVVYESKPVFDEKFQDELFDVAKIPDNEKEYRKLWDVAKEPYNAKNKKGARPSLEKLKYDTIGDLIRDDWHWEDYEVQRPGGIYIVDTAPVNTMMLAITRAGKGQTYIEPMIDMWTRETRANNIIINDPKGELLRKFYAPMSYRQYEIVQFNLINSMNTDIGNVLGYASEAAREGNFVKCPAYVQAMGDIFFPMEGADDPMWPSAANNAFQRACFGLIDLYREEEMELRRTAIKTKMSHSLLEQKIDELWGHCTLYNAYQFFVILSSKQSKEPEKIVVDPEVYEQWVEETEIMRIQTGNPDAVAPLKLEPKDFLTLFFDATNLLPKNSLRTLAANADNSLRAMAKSDKTIASVYGIALTAMSFFTDPTISTLTSGRPSQNFDMQGLSFPRRLGVRFGPEYRNKYKIIGLLSEWSAYDDKEFTHDLGSDFKHSEIISREGWAKYYFDGKFKNRVNYIKCEIKDPVSDALVKTFYFKFTIGYRTSLDGLTYQTEPITGEKIRKDGILEELVKNDDGTFTNVDSMMKVKKIAGFFNNEFTFMDKVDKDKIANVRKSIRVYDGDESITNEITKKCNITVNDGNFNIEPPSSVDKNDLIVIYDSYIPVIEQTMVAYTEKPKAVFLVTPPHLMSYAKLILILVKQMVDVNFEGSYMTKPSQKPLYKTRYMLDEVGNLQSEGHGIPGLQTMLSIGLGQDQQFTLILQTLQQIRDVYGDSADKIIQGNVANIIFLKSTDDSMIDTLVKLSGTTHIRSIDQEVITTDEQRQFNSNESMISITKSQKEEPVIKMNDLLYISKSAQNSVVFRAGDFPIWNRNLTALPMSWKLFGNTISVPGRKFSLQTVPTLSTASEFDVRMNQPNFYRILEKRVRQARLVPGLMDKYQKLHGYSDHEMELLDSDILSDEIMSAVQSVIEAEDKAKLEGKNDESYFAEPMYGDDDEDCEVNINERLAAEQQAESQNEKIYANGCLSKFDIMPNGQANHTYDILFCKAFEECKKGFYNDSDFSFDDSSNVYHSQTNKLLISHLDGSEIDAINEAYASGNARVPNEIDDSNIDIRYKITDNFYEYLALLDDWSEIANGSFDKSVERLWKQENNISI